MSIRLSPKHGVNPVIPKCFYCNEDKNEVILAGRLKGDAEAPRNAVWDMEPCDKCKGYMKQGIILISVDEEKSDDERNPYRTGGWVVIKEKAVRHMMTEEAANEICKRRVGFVPDEVWDAIGLPRGKPDGDNELQESV